MSAFSDINFIKKLTELNNSQQSIQTLSLWLIHHRKHSKTIVDVWYKNLQNVRTPKKLTFLYLANDVIQNSKKKGPEFNRDFRTVLADAFELAYSESDSKARGSMERILNVWKERHVFSSDIIKNCQVKISALGSASNTPVDKPKKSEKYKTQKSSKPSRSSKTKSTAEPEKKRKKVELSLREEIEAEGEAGQREPPDADDLEKALQELEHSASSDAVVREKIAALPPEVSDVSLLETIPDKAAADKLMMNVDDACTLLADYNSRLGGELEERRECARMLRDFIRVQKEQVADSEKKLKEYKSKLEKVSSVRKELKSHIQSLPDLTLLPDVTGGLAPLPSAGDLFAL